MFDFSTLGEIGDYQLPVYWRFLQRAGNGAPTNTHVNSLHDLIVWRHQ
jgi:hypothetical protein